MSNAAVRPIDHLTVGRGHRPGTGLVRRRCARALPAADVEPRAHLSAPSPTSLEASIRPNRDPDTGRWYVPEDYGLNPAAFGHNGHWHPAWPTGATERRMRAAVSQHHVMRHLRRHLNRASVLRALATHHVAESTWAGYRTGRAWLSRDASLVVEDLLLVALTCATRSQIPPHAAAPLPLIESVTDTTCSCRPGRPCARTRLPRHGQPTGTAAPVGK